jgi:hypothetical protein
MASPSTVITMGYGNGTLSGSPSLIVTLGYGIGAAAAVTFGRLEYTIPRHMLQYTVPSQRMDYTLPKTVDETAPVP